MSTRRPAKKPPIGDEHHEQKVWDAAEHVRLREDRYLENRRDEEDDRGLDSVDAVHRFFVEMSAATVSSESKRANGSTCTVRYDAMSLRSTESTRRIGMPDG